MIGLLLVGLVPFTVLGTLLGHMLPADSGGVAMGGAMTLFALARRRHAWRFASRRPGPRRSREVLARPRR